MEQPTKIEIDNKLNELIEEKILREDISEWALYYIRNDENIEIVDLNAWRYLVAISNVDEMISPTNYLYAIEDIQQWMKEYSKNDF
jgi:hypothetical protein